MKSSILLITEPQGHKQCIADTERNAVRSNKLSCFSRNKPLGKERQATQKLKPSC